MNDSSVSDLLTKCEKYRRQWKWERWVAIILATVLIFAGFFAFSLEDGHVFRSTVTSPFLISCIGGGLLGSVIRRWAGNKELLLLKEVSNELARREEKT